MAINFMSSALVLESLDCGSTFLSQFCSSDLFYSYGLLQVEGTQYTERSCRISGETEGPRHRHNSASIHCLSNSICCLTHYC